MDGLFNDSLKGRWRAFAARLRRVCGAFAACLRRVCGAFAARLRRVCGAFAARMTHVYVFMRNRQYIYCDNDEKSPVYILRQWSDRHYCPAKRLGLNEKIRTARFFSFLDFVLSEASGIQWKNVKLLKNACFCDFSNRGQCWKFSAPKFVKYFEVF